MNEVAKEWVEKAEEDFDSADLLLHAGEEPLSSSACFHCQQRAEKYLKVFLTEHLVRFERTHVLADILGLCIPVDQDFGSIANDLSNLEGYAVAIRYPGAIVSAELAEDALEAAKEYARL